MTLTLPHARRHFAFRALLLGLTLLFGALHVAQLAPRPAPGKLPWDARLEAEWIARSRSDPAHRWSQKLFPEGELFEAEFYGLALANIAETTRAPEDIDRASRGIRELLAELETVLHHKPFSPMEKWELRGGIMWFGGQNLLRAELVRLAPDVAPEELARFHADSATLAKLYQRSPAGLLDSLPGATWPADNVFAWRSLQLHDERFGTRYAEGFPKLREKLERGADPASGLAPSAMSLAGLREDVPRGCALSWSLSTLPALDPDYAKQQWSAYRRHFFRCAGGLCLIREYPAGVSRRMDADSGPIIDGLGMAASGLGLAAARANGDLDAAAALQRTGELLGFPGLGWWGKRYWGGEVTFFDVLALWAKTFPLPSHSTGAAPALPPALFILAAAYLLLALAQLPGLLHARRWLRDARGTSAAQRALEWLTYGLLLLQLAWPSMRLWHLVGGWAVLGLISSVLALLARGRSAPVPSAACVDSASPSQP